MQPFWFVFARNVLEHDVVWEQKETCCQPQQHVLCGVGTESTLTIHVSLWHQDISVWTEILFSPTDA